MTRTPKSKIRRGLWLATLSLTALGIADAPAAAELLDSDFVFQVGPYEAVLAAGVESGPFPHECGSVFVEYTSHTLPFISLRNTSTMPLDQVMITIGDTGYHFTDDVDVNDDGSDDLSLADPGFQGFVVAGLLSDIGTDDISVVATTLSGGAPSSVEDQHKLTIDFLGGLLPGEQAILRVGVANDDLAIRNITPFVDYRSVFFSMDNPAVVTVSSDPGTVDEMSAVMTFPGVETGDLAAIGFNAPSGELRVTEIFEPTMDFVIPEPTSAALATVVALAALASHRRAA